MENYYFNIIGRIKYILLLSLFFVSCKKIFETDITDQVVQVIIPQDGSSTTVNNVHFKWEAMDGADSYRLQVVSPSFLTINTYNLDSLVSGTEFYHRSE